MCRLGTKFRTELCSRGDVSCGLDYVVVAHEAVVRSGESVSQKECSHCRSSGDRWVWVAAPSIFFLLGDDFGVITIGETTETIPKVEMLLACCRNFQFPHPIYSWV